MMALNNFFNIADATKLISLSWTSWKPLDSPCLLENVNLPLELGFLVILLVQLLRNWMDRLRKQTKVSSDVNPTAIKYGFSYKIGLFCTAILFVVHAFMLVLMLNHGTQCTSQLQAFTSEIIQLISWGVCVITISKMSKSNAYFPGTLRVWWLCSFLLSITSTALHVHFSVTNKGQIGIRECGDLLGMVASTCLLVVSARGKTDIVLIATDGISESLLGEKKNFVSKSKGISIWKSYSYPTH